MILDSVVVWCWMCVLHWRVGEHSVDMGTYRVAADKEAWRFLYHEWIACEKKGRKSLDIVDQKSDLDGVGGSVGFGMGNVD